MRLKRVERAACVLALMHAVSCAPQSPNDEVGHLTSSDKAFTGYTLFAPCIDTTTYLIDMDGHLVHCWESGYEPAQSAYLLENGHLLRTAASTGPGNKVFHGGGAGGRVEEFSWDGQLVWTFEYASEAHLLHHDIEPLPNGNVLMIAWERKSAEEAVAAGRDPALQGDDDLWCDCVIEVEPTPPEGGRVVWKWHAWDHLVQNRDPDKPNYAEPSERPERIDVNWADWVESLTDEQREQLEAVGYLATAQRPQHRHRNPDWTHTNSVAYNPALDQIVLSVLGFNEIWIIDHSTSTEEAGGRTGGRSGKGGDLLYRWGNPRAYGRGGPEHQQSFAQHDARWIAGTSKGSGNILIFNNGRGRSDGDYSSVDEIAPPLDEEGRYACKSHAPFGPDRPVWTYRAETKEEFYSDHISGAQRLPDGNTLICSGVQGQFFEVTPEGEKVWEYVSPIFSRHRPGPPGGPGGPRGLVGRHQPPPRPPGRPGGGGPMRDVFRAYRYGPDYPGFADKDLTPGPAIARKEVAGPRPRGMRATGSRRNRPAVAGNP